MIDPRELRIGNYLQFGNDLIDKVLTICFDRREGFLINGQVPVELIEPIPLTTEILAKCGFEWDIYWQGITDGNWVLTEGEKGYKIAYGKRRHDTILWGIQWLHQFQNLYYSLTGTELNYRP